MKALVSTGGDQPEYSLWKDSAEFVTLREITAAAEARLASEVWAFIEGGAGDEVTLRRCRDAFARWEFLPRYQCGVAPADTTTMLLGQHLPTPVVGAPYGMDTLFHPDGFLAVARAHARTGTLFTVPCAGSFSLEEVAAAAPDCPKWFNMVPNGDADAFVSMARRAGMAGYLALCVTVDGPPAGWRERSMESRFVPDISTISGNFRLPSGGVDVEAIQAFGRFDGPQWTWDQLGDVCARSGVPFIVKGILTAEDARAAVDVGAAGVWVSNHGGRQLDSAPASLVQLPEVVTEVGDRADVILDSGVRRGSDVLKAVAMGAQAVAVGRLSTYGLAAGGEEGVARVLDLLDQELRVTMALCGRDRIDAVDQDLLRAAVW